MYNNAGPLKSSSKRKSLGRTRTVAQKFRHSDTAPGQAPLAAMPLPMSGVHSGIPAHALPMQADSGLAHGSQGLQQGLQMYRVCNPIWRSHRRCRDYTRVEGLVWRKLYCSSLLSQHAWRTRQRQSSERSWKQHSRPAQMCLLL
jgi:hypothetical protein